MASADVSEYDAFGPWVDEVTRPQDVPRLYRAHPIDFAHTDLVLKIPRDIERRNATPAMHLYDGLVILAEGMLTLLSRDGDRYTTRSVRLGEVFALVDSVHLLDGRLELHTSLGAPLVVRYNAASHDRIRALVARMRRLILDASGPEPADASAHAREPADHGRVELPHAKRDYGLFGAWAALQAEVPGLELAAAHPSVPLRPFDDGIVGLFYRLRPTMGSAMILGVSPREVHLIHRRAWTQRRSGDDLSMAHTVVFRGSGAAVEVAEHPIYEGLDTVRIARGDGVLELALPRASGAGGVLAAAIAR